jgi:hypothetical protein
MASLQVTGDDLVPNDVSSRLRCQPTHSHAKGEVVARQARIPPRTASFGMWSLVAEETGPADVDAQVTWLINQVSDDLTDWRWLGERFRTRLFCGWFMTHLNEGLTLSSPTLAKLGQRGVLIDIDLYGPGD